ncbi:DNA topoisomerase 2-alpha [Labeo rohita]|uniref:DNA topoisomerase 2-alpha n=1 Tax=Labeo rohita TaxID=84645 RepID=A0ABQ8MQZ8_LABRO|nr:DNA topoisomerase 2-alpha [Labeo rohita]
MDLASANVAPRRGNTILEGFTIFIFQNGRDLEDYVEEFVGTCHRAICDVCLMEGFRCGLDDDLCFALPDGDPCWTLKQYINLVLCACGSAYTVGEAEEYNNLVQPHLADVSQQDPKPSQTTPQLAKPEPKPTSDGEPEPRATVPSPMGATACEIATEPDPSESDQVRDPVTEPATVDVPVGREGAEDSTAHCTTAEGSHAASVIPPLVPDSPANHPQSTICAVGSPRICQSPSASWLEDPSSPPPASESWTLPRPFDPAATPRLSAPSSPPSPVGPPAPPGSIVPPDPRVALDHRLSVSASGSTSTCSAAVGWPPGVVSPSSTSVSSLAPPSVRPTLDTSVSSLAPPSIVTTLDFVCCPPPGSLSSA